MGYDREKHGSDAGIRTYAAVCLGATIFTAVAAHIQEDAASPSRVIANIVTGVGFIGAGIIYKGKDADSSRGLTTAATVWAASGVGVAIGMDMYIIALVATCITCFLLALHHMRWYRRWKQRIKDNENHSND